MSVSYLSQTFKNSPYVPPIDLDLMAKVLSYKQGQFDQNAIKVQTQINQLNSLDVIKDEDRQYISNKVNNLVNSLNSFGGVDLGDANISNQLESYASDIYSDTGVINAVSSTKRIRNLQATYEKYKTDPKLTKYFSDANYTIDMEKVNNYLSDGQAGTAYQGNSSATPFYDYNKEFNDMFKKVVSDEYSRITPDGYYIRKENGERVTPEKVMESARGRMSGNARSQMERDATYLYKYKAGYGKEEVVSKALQTDVQEIARTERLIADTKSDIAIESDPKKKAQLQSYLSQYQTANKEQKTNFEANKTRYSSLYDSNPTELMYKGFSDDYFKAIGLQYSYNKITNDLKQDPVRVMIYNAGERRYLKQKEIDAAFALEGMKENAALQRALIAAGAKAKTTLNPEGVSDILPNTNPDVESAYHDAAKVRLDSGIPTEVSKVSDDYWSKLVQDNVELQTPEFGYLSQRDETAILQKTNKPYSDNNPGFFSPSSEGGLNKAIQWIIGDNKDEPVKNNPSAPAGIATYDLNKDGKVNIQDFQGSFLGKPAYDFIVLNPKAKEIISHAVKALQDKAAGKPVVVSQLPDGTADYVEKISLLNQEKDNLNWSVSKYESGDKSFLRNQYAAKIISDDAKTQASVPIGTVKSYIKAHNDVSTSFDVVEAGPATDGSGNFIATIKEKDNNGNSKDPRSVIIPSQVAKEIGLEKGPYDILNTTVTKTNPFICPVQNQFDKNLVGNLKVYKNGNDESYTVAYLYPNSVTGEVQQIKFKDIPPQISAALAWSRGKEKLQNFGANVPDKTNLKTLFEQQLLNQ